jgi:integrase
MNIRFNLARKNADISIILLSATWNGNRIQISIGESIKPKQWNIDLGKARKSFPNSAELNRFLDNIRNQIESFYYEQKAIGKIPDKNELKEFAKSVLHPDLKKTIHKKEKYLLEYFKLFMNERIKSGQYKANTIKKYQTTYNHLKDYQKYIGKKITFDMMEKKFHDDFVLYLNTQKEMANNSVGNIIKFLKTFLTWALEKEYHSNTKYMKAFTANKKDADQIALTPNEVGLIESMETTNLRLKKVKDLFLIQTYTMLRYSDMENLKPENIDISNEMIKIYVIKTEDMLFIPIHKKLKEILKEYPDLKLPIISHQKYNDYLKELCKLAGIDSPIQKTKYIGRKRIDETYAKYELVTSHTARHTGITYLLRKGLLPESVMKISGHKSRTAFQKYVNIAQNEAVEEVRKVWEG